MGTVDERTSGGKAVVSASEEAAGCWGADGVGAIGGRRGNVCPAGEEEEEEDGGPLVQPPYFFPAMRRRVRTW